MGALGRPGVLVDPATWHYRGGIGAYLYMLCSQGAVTLCRQAFHSDLGPAPQGRR